MVSTVVLGLKNGDEHWTAGTDWTLDIGSWDTDRTLDIWIQGYALDIGLGVRSNIGF